MARSRKPHGTGPDVQPHIQKARAEFKRFIDANGLLAEEPEITIDDGLLSINLTRPLTFAEMRSLSYLFSADPDMIRGKHQKTEAKMREKRGEDYVEAEERVKISSFSILARTTKMGAYSFNLPAGPTGMATVKEAGDEEKLALLGTCPVSAKFWPLPEYRRNVTTNALGTEAIKGRTDQNWICGSCYAMKGAYGSPSSIMIQEFRRQWVMSFAHRENGSRALATWLTRAIRWAQLASIKSKRSLSGQLDKAGEDRSIMVPDPSFFRIHDAGDFGIGPWYVDSWFETARRCADPKTIRVPKSTSKLKPEFIDGSGSAKGEECTLPAVHFWAATRAWTVMSGLEQYVKSLCASKHDDFCVPTNLSLRPSALYFGDTAPVLNGKHLPVVDSKGDITIGGYASGTTADTLEQAKTSQAWACPAYTPTDPTRPKASQPGACQKSRGPEADTNPADRPAPEGHGCRTCWLQPERAVTYIRH